MLTLLAAWTKDIDLWFPNAFALQAGSEVKLWEVSSGEERTRLEGHTGTVMSITFVPDRSVVATGGEDKTVRLSYKGLLWDELLVEVARAHPRQDARFELLLRGEMDALPGM